MFTRLPAAAELEDGVLEFWDSQRIFERVLAESRDKPPFVFYEGPPTANGTPHNGHVLTRVIKDVFPRYKTMRGYFVHRKAGWDTHGLPVEVEVEKKLGIHGREAIEAYGLEKFSRECVQSVFTYVREWEELTKQIGFWVDLDQAYVTFHRSYVESVWWALSELFKKGLLYQGHKVVWWWPQGGTTLSAGEVGMGYKEVDDPAITIRFRDVADPSVSFLAWTTTPWTLPSNVALAVGAELDYAVCEDPGGGTVIVAAKRAESYGLTPSSILKGKELIGRRYVPLFSFGPVEGGDAFVVVAGHHVTTDTGTGIVHVAPAFGEDDMLVAKQQGLGLLQWIDPSGKFLPETGEFAGKFCKAADPDIIRNLKERGFLFKRDTYRHSYPFCWRADTDPLIQYARPAWFIRTTEVIDQVIANNQAIGWLPEHIRDGRFGDFLRNNVDWALSRERFWGTPLNIWTCSTCEHRLCPSSTAEIKALNPQAFDPNVDEHLQIHRPWIDRVELPCAVCGGVMKRVPEVIDCWFDSGCMPFAQWGWPHQGDAEFKRSFPADFISEAVDQTRGWFYSLLAIGTLLFDDATCEQYGLGKLGFPRPYKNCIVLGHVCDMDGRKESKSKGNYTSPNLVLRGRTRLDAYPDPSLARGSVGLKPDQISSLDLGKDDRIRIVGDGGSEEALSCKLVATAVKPKDAVYMHPEDLRGIGLPETGGKVIFATPGEPPGADAFRWLFCSSNAPWANTRLSMRAIRDGQREFLLRLRNVYQFFAIYADIAKTAGHFDPVRPAPRIPAQRDRLDRWILHQLDVTIETVTTEMDRWHLYEASRALSAFVEDLSNWYVRRSRTRFWGEGPELQDALYTLYECLVTLSQLMAPFVPFMAEALHQALVVGPLGSGASSSVHLCEWPKTRPEIRDPKLADDMAVVRELASLGLAARANSKIKVRQPLHAVTLVLVQPQHRAAVEGLAELLEDELNVHRVEFATEVETYVSFQVKPDFKKLGARLGKDMKSVASAISNLDPAHLKRSLEKGDFALTVDGRTFSLSADDVLVTIVPKGEYQAASSWVGVLAISTVLDDDLRSEGVVRELVNRVQNLRKELDLGYTQRISLIIGVDKSFAQAVERHADYLRRETLAREFHVQSDVSEDEILQKSAVTRQVDVEGYPVVVGLTLIA